MKHLTHYFSLLIFIFFAQAGSAQCPTDSYLFLKTQASVDSFPIQYPNCTAMPNSLIIGTEVTEPANDIHDLTPLSQLASCGGLRISKTALINLQGLSNLESTGFFTVSDNLALESLVGTKLETVYGDLTIAGNNKLHNFVGLDSLKFVKSSFKTLLNDSLINFEGLGELSSIAGDLLVSSNPSLESLDGLSNLHDIHQYLRILNNPKLNDISALENVEPSFDQLEIIGNINLSECNIAPVCNALAGLSIDVDVTIENNKVGCNNSTEVASGCNAYSGLILYCPSNISVILPAGSTEVPVTWAAPDSINTCAIGADVTITPTNYQPGDTFAAGLYTVTYQATNMCMDTASCSFIITVGSSPAAFDINITHCPTAYPNSGEDYILDFTVTNTGGMPSTATTLSFVQPGAQANSPNNNSIGGVDIPAIGVGETYSHTKNFGPVISYPSDFTLYGWSTFFSDYFSLRTNFAPSQTNYEGIVGAFCKQFDSGLEVEVTADSYLIDSTGHLEYDIAVTNTGTEQAANVMVHVGPQLWGKNYITLVNQPADSEVFQSKEGEQDFFLRLALLDAGTSKTFHVNVDIGGDIDSIFDPNVYVYSHHQVSGGFHADINHALFYKEAPDLSVSNLINLVDTAYAGEIVGYDFDLHNLGNITADSAYRIGMYLSTDSIFDAADVAVGEILTAATAVGTVPMVHGAIAIPTPWVDGAYYLIVVADADETIVEANENNNQIAAPIIILNPVSLDEASFQSIAIQPNPATDLIRIVSSEKIDKVLIYNAFGQLVLQGVGQEYDVASLPEGLFWVLVFVGGKVESGCFLKGE